MQSEGKTLIDSAVVGFTHPGPWTTYWLSLHTCTSDMVSFFIYWEDLACTWHLRRSNSGTNIGFAVDPDDEITLAYRALDPAWIDPVLGDPRQLHVVSFRNPGAAYVRLDYTAVNWAGANHYLKVVGYWNQTIR